MKKGRKKSARQEQLQEELDRFIPDREEQQQMMQGLYQGKPLFGESGVFTGMLQKMVNLSLQGELDSFLKEQPENTDNRRNGFKQKQVRSTGGMLTVNTPRDRSGEYAPMLVKNWERELTTGMDEIIL